MTSMGQPKPENVNANPIHKLTTDYKVAFGLGTGSECDERLMGQFEVVWQIRKTGTKYGVKHKFEPLF